MTKKRDETIDRLVGWINERREAQVRRRASDRIEKKMSGGSADSEERQKKREEKGRKRRKIERERGEEESERGREREKGKE